MSAILVPEREPKKFQPPRDHACIAVTFRQHGCVINRLGHVLLIAAVLAMTGTHWFVLQSVAWTTMLAGNLRGGSFSEAVQKTFDGDHPCPLCKQIAQGKQEEKKSDVQIELKKLEFSYSPSVFVFTAPSFHWEIRTADDRALLLRYAPPVPPPKSFLA